MCDIDSMQITNPENKTLIISNIDKYNIEFVNNRLVLTLKKTYINEKNISHYDLKRSDLIECKINKEIMVNPSYIKLLKYVWKKTPINKIIQNTIFNIKLAIEHIEGDTNYNWSDDLNFAFQPRNTNKTIKEIIHMSKLNNISLDLLIKLENNNTINLVI
jgi:hypothetical protein